MRESVEARNSLENYAYQIRNTINDEEKLGGKISEEDKETLEAAVKDVTDFIITWEVVRMRRTDHEQHKAIGNV